MSLPKSLEDYLIDPETNEVYNSETFSLDQFLSGIDTRLLLTAEGRRELCRYNPLLFILVYLPHVFKSEATNNQLSLNDLNLLLCHHALQWTLPKNQPKRKGNRRAYLAPRSSGKSSTIKALLLWALAYKHLRYVMILSGSDTQVVQHLASIRKELDNNKVLRADFEGFCTPQIWKRKAVAEADRANKYTSRHGVTIEARSISSSVLGAKEGDTRPDGILLDDPSRGEGVGSATQSATQLEILLGTILPLNHNAVVLSIGTVHFVGSIEDQMRRSLEGESFSWINEEGFEVHWVRPLPTRPDGSLRSMWEAQWSTEWLMEESNKRTFFKDFLNSPMPAFGGMSFEPEDFIIESLPSIPVCIISVDPGITEKGDATGISVIGFSPVARKAIVLDVMAVHLKAVDLKKKILELVNIHNPQYVLYESNQGGEMLAQATLGPDFPIPIRYVHAKESKALRAEILLTRYRKRQIVHAKKFPSYEMECRSFPRFTKSPNQLDSVAHGIEYISQMNLNNESSPSSLSISQRRM